MQPNTAMHQPEGQGALTPMQIVDHPLFTAREKIEFLEELRARVAGTAIGREQLGFDPDEVDAAIAEVRQRTQQGIGNRAEVRGSG